MSVRGVLHKFLAIFRLSKRAVCEESVGKGLYDDYHDYPDSVVPYPFRGFIHDCARCGKRFCI